MEGSQHGSRPKETEGEEETGPQIGFLQVGLCRAACEQILLCVICPIRTLV